ncbi:MAG: ATP-binding protein [Alphaproteobacteria bacterium]|nr:ATP-binding protein [Alphaproteobacteria bacterium]
MLQKNTILSPVEWEKIARPKQLMPKGNWRIWMMLAGRGFGKTRAAAEAIRKLVISGKYRRVALIANTIQEAKQVMVEGHSGLLSICSESDGLIYTPSKRLLSWNNGAIATIYGAENYEQLRGPQFDAAWIDEFAKFMYPRETFDQLSFSLRLGPDPKVILTTTPRPIQFIKDLMERPDVVTVRGSSLENEANLSPAFLQQLEYLKGSRLEAQEIYAEIVENNTNTLWSWDDIESCYKNPPHFLDNIVIGVDPAVTSTDNSDETGIIVAGKDAFGKAYVLEDASMNASSDEWASKITDLYDRYRARQVIIEANAGGELLTRLLKSKNGDMRVKAVYAHKSKIARAAPIVLLYQRKMIFHAMQFRKLEMQMATYVPGEKSPDRLDAMVWAMTELFSSDIQNDMPGVFLA